MDHIRDVKAAIVVLAILAWLPAGQPMAQDRLKAGETLGAKVQRAVTCEEMARLVARVEGVLTPQEVRLLKDAILVGRPECRQEDAR